MIAVDTNLLVYAHRAENPFHKAADNIIKPLAEGRASWAIPWPCLHEFYNIVTHPRIHQTLTPPSLAITQIDAWMESPSLVLLSENGSHWPLLRDLITKAKLQGAMVHDARIAALCLGHGVRELWSADRDFSRFPGLRVRNPLL
jgi:toxin-antitoxin system PIN domain toxin